MNSLRGAIINSSVLRRLGLNKSAYSGSRCLFTDEFLGIDSFTDARENKLKTFGSMKENFMTRMKHQLSGSSAAMVFTEDLKSVIYLTEDKPEELNTCSELLKRFNKQNKELRFGTFVFGPIVMRLLHHLQKPDIGLQLINDQEMTGFFDQIKSYLVLMDLLMDSGRYQDVIDLFDQLKANQVIDTKFPRDTTVLAAAACYKLNTPESLTYAMDVVTKCRSSGYIIVRRAIHLVAALALNQKRPDVAMELLSSLTASNYITYNNLKIITFAHLGRFQDAFQILQRKLENDYPKQTTVRGGICQEALGHLKEAVNNAGDTETSATFERLSKSLEESDFLTQQGIEELLLMPILPRLPQETGIGAGLRQNQARGERQDPFFRRRPNIPVKQRAFGSIMTE